MGAGKPIYNDTLRFYRCAAGFSRRCLLAVVAAVWCLSLNASQTIEPVPRLTLHVPASPGGGYDLTARAMRRSLTEAGLVGTVDIVHSPGAGGLIGLASFVEARRADPNALIIGGMFTVGAVASNNAAVSLMDTVPVARLTGDFVAVAVPDESPFTDMDDLLEALLDKPENLLWVGGSAGGSDEILLYQLARELDISPARIDYDPLPGGGEVGRTLTAGNYSAGVSGYSEFEQWVDSGRLRVLALSAENPVPDINIPTFRALGIDISLVNWRGVFAPPGVGDVRQQQLTSLMAGMVTTSSWRKALATYHWQDLYLSGEDFDQFVAAEHQRPFSGTKRLIGNKVARKSAVHQVLARRYRWVTIVSIVAALLALALFWVHAEAARRERQLIEELEVASADSQLKAGELEKTRAGVSAHVHHEFDKWGLTEAEQDVALLMLKGLLLKDIAVSRGTSERTVRQQAKAVYEKSGLRGRSGLAAYFLKDLFASI